jgi:hypothetical protein
MNDQDFEEKMTSAIIAMVFDESDSNADILQRLTPTSPPYSADGVSPEQLRLCIARALQLKSMSDQRLTEFLGFLDSRPISQKLPVIF